MTRPLLAALLLGGLAAPAAAAPVLLCEGRLRAEVSAQPGGAGLQRHAGYAVRVENTGSLPLRVSLRVDAEALLAGMGDAQFRNAASPLLLGTRAATSVPLGTYRGAEAPPGADAVQRHLAATCGHPGR